MCILWGTNWSFCIPEDDILHSHCRGNLKSYNPLLLYIGFFRVSSTIAHMTVFHTDRLFYKWDTFQVSHNFLSVWVYGSWFLFISSARISSKLAGTDGISSLRTNCSIFVQCIAWYIFPSLKDVGLIFQNEKTKKNTLRPSVHEMYSCSSLCPRRAVEKHNGTNRTADGISALAISPEEYPCRRVSAPRKIWGFHGGDYEELCLLGRYAVWLL
jgi:hypothetical protein